ncbi:hypothetical protein DPMN_063013 [Dreissena polymorpha]|uniref:Uncharacterized protein n=1 Tax=Dreissena polymorpha TaxID=45954 RepID=A0A9D4CAQ9_DREPO|nr:hypothetical protein DPMN_063013 [Dreissena polymorpha]
MPPYTGHTNVLTKFYEDWTINVKTVTIFELIQDIIGTNLLTKFHEDRTLNMASRLLTRKNAPPPWCPYIIGTNLLTKFHDDRTINSRVLTRKNTPPQGRPCFSTNQNQFRTHPRLNGINLLTEFHEDPDNKCKYILTTLLEDLRFAMVDTDSNLTKINILGKFHKDSVIYVTSRVVTRFSLEMT